MLVHRSGGVGWQVIRQILNFHFIASVFWLQLVAINCNKADIYDFYKRELVIYDATELQERFKRAPSVTLKWSCQRFLSLIFVVHNALVM